MTKIKSGMAAAFILLMLNGCSILPKDDASIVTYDFGLPRQNAPDQTTRIADRLEVSPVTAPSWLDSPAILYRLAYHNAARLDSYADSRWAAPPAALITLRLRQALPTASDTPKVNPTPQNDPPNRLRVDLEEFSQVFDAPQSSRVLLRAHVTLTQKNEQTPLRERTFSLERQAQTPDAAGAVSALRQASDELIDAVLNWLARTPDIR
ncbi:MAG TPA: PqiC family protein [Gammaproteobacteria bacterium]|nr:PqiC family protein [Gammaproteobacteria bacterium]